MAWDIPLTEGYDFELVPNVSKQPGSSHFFGIRTPDLVARVQNWKPDAVHITGYAYASHLNAVRSFHRDGIPVLFRGDSHLLDQRPGPRWWLKKALLHQIYRWVTACLYVGQNNYQYYAKIGVPKEKLLYCPHCIEVDRFAEPNQNFEDQAAQWRRDLKIPDFVKVVVYAGKFEERKQPVQLMRTIRLMARDDLVLAIVGNGPLEQHVMEIAQDRPEMFRVLPFQNQTTMPVVYRLADVFVLPSAFGETWGLALNESLACGRRVLASDRVGGAVDLVTSQREGAIFKSGDWNEFSVRLLELLGTNGNREEIQRSARRFDVSETERTLCDALEKILGV